METERSSETSKQTFSKWYKNRRKGHHLNNEKLKARTSKLFNGFDICFSVHFRLVLSDTPTNAQMIFIIQELAYMFRP